MTIRPAAQISWNAKTSRMYSNLKKRGGVAFDLPKFRAWLATQARNYLISDKRGLFWRCPYFGEYINLSDVSMDHKLPFAAVQCTTLENLVVTTERANRIKGRLSHDAFVKLLKLMDEQFSVDEKQDVLARLAHKPKWSRR